MSGKLIYLTGAPATGKSTLGKAIIEYRRNIELISYSTELINYVNKRSASNELDETKIRTQSANVITEDDVSNVDISLIEKCNYKRKSTNIIIDSHPVTKEDYGFRITGFKQNILQMLSPDVILCLYTDPNVISERIKNESGGRPLPSIYEITLHIQTQINLATTYGIISDCPVYLIDSNKEINELVQIILRRCKFNI